MYCMYTCKYMYARTYIYMVVVWLCVCVSGREGGMVDGGGQLVGFFIFLAPHPLFFLTSHL